MNLKLNPRQKLTRKRIIKISYECKLSHLGSCLSAVDLIDVIYEIKKPSEKFVLSNGHAGLALYVVLEKYGFIKDPSILKSLHVHPDRNPKAGIHVSTGSLGHGLPTALGMAFTNKNKAVYCMISDGEAAEGSIWETLRIASENNIHNLRVVVNANGWGAYDYIDSSQLINRIRAFGWKVTEVDGHNLQDIKKGFKQDPKNKPVAIFAKTTVEQLPFLKGQDAHYHIMTKEEFETAMMLLK